MRVLHAFCCHSYIILIHLHWLLLLESVLRFLDPLSCVLRKQVIWVLSKFNWLVVTWCEIWVRGILEQITNSFISFHFCLLEICFCVANSRVFFEYVSFINLLINFNRFFNLHIGNFLIELHFIFIAFILFLIVILCFWSYSGRHSFYTFRLMHSLKKVFEQTENNWF